MDVVREALKGLYTHTVGRRIIHFSRVGSTMDVAAQEGRAGAFEGTVVVADEQTRGRGRLERTWVSLADNLHLSVLLRPELKVAPLIMVVAGVVLVRAIRDVTGLRARLKWPNDVILRGRKVAGILAEGVTGQSGESYAVLGIGVNVNSDPSNIPELASIATSLSRETGAPLEKGALLRRILQELDYLYRGLQQGQVPLDEWRGYLDTLGRRVRVEWRGEVCRGLAEDVDERGSLVLRSDDGSRVTLPAGEVSYLR
jgi:BirA family biotin operon repressor/biotin-[acetyl-CoA-carboxylase] ligase